MYHVVTIGSATLDAFLCCVNLYTAEVNGEKKVLLPYGAKIELDEVLFETGGGGTNTATTFSRNGLKTAVIAKIGDDFSGAKVLEHLSRDNISTDFIKKSLNDTTDYATIIWAPRVGNVIIVCRGKSRLEVSDIDWVTIQTKWFYVSSVEGNLDVPHALSQHFSSQNPDKPKIAWNPGKRELLQKDVTASLLPSIELFIVNRLEASMFTQTDIQDITAILAAIEKLPPKMKIVTDGHNGSYFYNGSQWMRSDAFQVEKQEATGAGDAYGSAFVAGLIQGKSEEECLKMAAANAASVVMHPGAKRGILKKEEMGTWLAKNLEIKILV